MSDHVSCVPGGQSGCACPASAGVSRTAGVSVTHVIRWRWLHSNRWGRKNAAVPSSGNNSRNSKGFSSMATTTSVSVYTREMERKKKLYRERLEKDEYKTLIKNGITCGLTATMLQLLQFQQYTLTSDMAWHLRKMYRTNHINRVNEYHMSSPLSFFKQGVTWDSKDKKRLSFTIPAWTPWNT